RLAQLALAAGLPPGVLNVVDGLGEPAGKAVTERPALRASAFVGESVTGARLMAPRAPPRQRLHRALRRKSPAVLGDDPRLPRPLDGVSFMIYSLNGERCTSGSRVLVQRGVYEEFTAALAARADGIRVGDPFDPATEVGPLIHPEHLAKVT